MNDELEESGCSLRDRSSICVTSGFRRDVDQICALLEYYAALSGNSVPTFRDNLSVPSSRGTDNFSETSV
jgi:hypothetical protein